MPGMVISARRRVVAHPPLLHHPQGGQRLPSGDGTMRPGDTSFGDPVNYVDANAAEIVAFGGIRNQQLRTKPTIVPFPPRFTYQRLADGTVIAAANASVISEIGYRDARELIELGKEALGDVVGECADWVNPGDAHTNVARINATSLDEQRFLLDVVSSPEAKEAFYSQMSAAEVNGPVRLGIAGLFATDTGLYALADEAGFAAYKPVVKAGTRLYVPHMIGGKDMFREASQRFGPDRAEKLFRFGFYPTDKPLTGGGVMTAIALATWRHDPSGKPDVAPRQIADAIEPYLPRDREAERRDGVALERPGFPEGFSVETTGASLVEHGHSPIAPIIHTNRLLERVTFGVERQQAPTLD
jgi:hypothetical protein